MKSFKGWLIFLAVILLLFPCMGIGIPADLFLNATFGWILFLFDVLPKVRVIWSGVATGLICLTLFAAGSHVFLGWLLRSMTGMRWGWRWTGSLIGGVVLMVVAGMATAGVGHQVGWLMVWEGPWTAYAIEHNEAGRRAQSQNNLKNIALAVLYHEDRRKTLPPGATFDKLGRPLHGWMTMTLPDIDQPDLYNQVNFQIPWDDPANKAIFQKKLWVYRNPGFGRVREQDDRGYALTHYAGNVHILGGDRPWKLDEIKDGTTQTILIGEAAGNFKAWGDPVNWRDPALGINKSPDGFGGPFKGGANFAFADGSVRFIKETIDPKVFKALGTPDGGERISEDDY